eukprot:676118-Amphidinium_carterae.1
MVDEVAMNHVSMRLWWGSGGTYLVVLPQGATIAFNLIDEKGAYTCIVSPAKGPLPCNLVSQCTRPSLHNASSCTQGVTNHLKCTLLNRCAPSTYIFLPGHALPRKHFRPPIPYKTKEKQKVSRASVYTKTLEK